MSKVTVTGETQCLGIKTVLSLRKLYIIKNHESLLALFTIECEELLGLCQSQMTPGSQCSAWLLFVVRKSRGAVRTSAIM